MKLKLSIFFVVITILLGLNTNCAAITIQNLASSMFGARNSAAISIAIIKILGNDQLTPQSNLTNEQESFVRQALKKSMRKDCIVDFFKMLAGAGVTATSLLGIFASVVGCGAPKEYMDVTGKILCSEVGGIGCVACAGASGLYTFYQFCKLLYDLSTLAQEEFKEKFREMVQEAISVHE